jgi:hypothetical protein
MMGPAGGFPVRPQPTGLSRAGLDARGVRTSRGVGQWTAGVVAQLLAWLPA